MDSREPEVDLVPFQMDFAECLKYLDKLVDSWVMVTFELKFSNVCRNNDGKHSSVMRPDSKQECLLKGFDLDSRKPEQWIGDS